MRFDQSIVSSTSYALMFGAGISSYKAQDPICFGGHILNMGVPSKIIANFKSQLFGMINRLKDLAMESIREFNGVSRTGNVQDLAFSGLKSISQFFSQISNFWTSFCNVPQPFSLLIAK